MKVLSLSDAIWFIPLQVRVTGVHAMMVDPSWNRPTLYALSDQAMWRGNIRVLNPTPWQPPGSEQSMLLDNWRY